MGFSEIQFSAFSRRAVSLTSADLPVLHDVLHATPTAELEPSTKDYVQSDEADMGMSYEELSRFGYLRKIQNCGPVSMFRHLVHEWFVRIRPFELIFFAGII